MGRRKTIAQETIIEAALRVIKRDGAAHMSVDAVATEAGICKASVLYDFKTKQALIHAIVRQQIVAAEARLDECRLAGQGPGSSEIDAIIATTDQLPSDDDRAGMFGLCTALQQDQGLRDMVRAECRKRLEAVTGTADHPRAARLAFLALEGLLWTERFDFHSWSADERRQLIDDIASLSKRPLGAASAH